ncbi:hypothetical protein BCV71DRAFT_74562 [Rhizopus microsporus]|uniref:Biogenesis of lysosome-related organelles complex 1 subunit 2 n=1 Tax=Rhizopus microsporus TaxID=58291 RepID=A0A1X0S9N3_RHIZD|nr:hypothetical protein BCV71DRAFT_74562 [Rhizopus microsporus]
MLFLYSKEVTVDFALFLFFNKMDNNDTKNLKPDEYTKGLNREHVIKLTEESCKHFVEYTKAELKVTVEDCKLLENMNYITKEKYSQMNQMSQRIMSEISKLQNTYDQFDQFITQVDDIHQQSIKMENTIKALDEYSKHLENKLSL